MNVRELYASVVDAIGQRATDVASGVLGTLGVIVVFKFIAWIA